MSGNLSSLNKGKHNRHCIQTSDTNQRRFLRFCFSVYSLVLISIQYSFEHIPKHLEVCQKYSTLFSVFRTVVKHSLLCFIYQFKLSSQFFESFQNLCYNCTQSQNSSMFLTYYSTFHSNLWYCNAVIISFRLSCTVGKRRI